MSNKKEFIENNVYKLLSYEHYISGSEISKQLEIKSPDVRVAIHSLRLKGVPIISNHSGYRLTNSYEELEQYIESLRRRASKIVNVILAIQKTTEKLKEKK